MFLICHFVDFVCHGFKSEIVGVADVVCLRFDLRMCDAVVVCQTCM